MTEFDDELFLSLSVDDLKEIDQAEKKILSTPRPAIDAQASARQSEMQKELMQKQGENRILRSRMHSIEIENQQLKSEISALRQSSEKEKEKLQVSLAEEIERVKTNRMFLAKSADPFRLSARHAHHHTSPEPLLNGTRASGLARLSTESDSDLLDISNEAQLQLTSLLKDHISNSAFDSRDIFISLLGDFVSLIYPKPEFTMLKWLVFLEKWAPDTLLSGDPSFHQCVDWLALFVNEMLESNFFSVSRLLIHGSPSHLERLSEIHLADHVCSLFLLLVDGSESESSMHLYALLDHLRQLYTMLDKHSCQAYFKLLKVQLLDKLLKKSARHLAMFFSVLCVAAPDFYLNVAAMAIAFHEALVPSLSTDDKSALFPAYVELLILLCSLKQTDQ